MIILAVTGIATTWFDWGPFWKGYVLDICGPAWNYILFRNLFTSYRENKWTRFFKPDTTFLIFSLVLLGIEGMQYLEWYDSTFDPLDFVAYFSILLPIYMIDKALLRNVI
jgi:hypothetical protein